MDVLTLYQSLSPAGEIRNKGNGEYCGPCPDCGGRDRFLLWPDHKSGAPGGRFLCRRCGAHGDAVDFLRRFRNLGYREACDALRLPRPARLAAKRPEKAFRDDYAGYCVTSTDASANPTARPPDAYDVRDASADGSMRDAESPTTWPHGGEPRKDAAEKSAAGAHDASRPGPIRDAVGSSPAGAFDRLDASRRGMMEDAEKPTTRPIGAHGGGTMGGAENRAAGAFERGAYGPGPGDAEGSSPARAWTPAPERLPRAEWMERAARFVATCAGGVETGPGLETLRGRGLSVETARALGFGWNPADRYERRADWGLEEEVNPQTGRPRKLWLPRGLVLPIRRKIGVAGLLIRRADLKPEDEAPKYWQVKGSGDGCFCLGRAGLPVALVESLLDAALIWQEGRDLVATCALTGATKRPDARTTAFLRAAPFILWSLDFDEAGRTAWRWWHERFALTVWPCAAGKDPGEMREAGVPIRPWLEAAFPSERETRAAISPDRRTSSSRKDPVPPAGALSPDRGSGRLEDALPKSREAISPDEGTSAGYGARGVQRTSRHCWSSFAPCGDVRSDSETSPDRGPSRALGASPQGGGAADGAMSTVLSVLPETQGDPGKPEKLDVRELVPASSASSRPEAEAPERSADASLAALAARDGNVAALLAWGLRPRLEAGDLAVEGAEALDAENRAGLERWLAHAGPHGLTRRERLIRALRAERRTT